MLDKERKGIKNLEGLSTKLIPHHGSGTSVMSGESNVGWHVVPSKFLLLPRDRWVRLECYSGEISKFRQKSLPGVFAVAPYYTSSWQIHHSASRIFSLTVVRIREMEMQYWKQQAKKPQSFCPNCEGATLSPLHFSLHWFLWSLPTINIVVLPRGLRISIEGEGGIEAAASWLQSSPRSKWQQNVIHNVWFTVWRM